MLVTIEVFTSGIIGFGCELKNYITKVSMSGITKIMVIFKNAPDIQLQDGKYSMYWETVHKYDAHNDLNPFLQHDSLGFHDSIVSEVKTVYDRYYEPDMEQINDTLQRVILQFRAMNLPEKIDIFIVIPKDAVPAGSPMLDAYLQLQNIRSTENCAGCARMACFAEECNYHDRAKKCEECVYRRASCIVNNQIVLQPEHGFHQQLEPVFAVSNFALNNGHAQNSGRDLATVVNNYNKNAIQDYHKSMETLLDNAKKAYINIDDLCRKANISRVTFDRIKNCQKSVKREVVYSLGIALKLNQMQFCELVSLKGYSFSPNIFLTDAIISFYIDTNYRILFNQNFPIDDVNSALIIYKQPQLNRR